MTHKLTPNKPAVIKAGEYNAAMEAGQWFSQQRQLGGGMSGSGGGINPCVVQVKNESGGDLAAGDVVEIGDTLLTTLDKSHLWFSAALKSSTGVCGVLLNPLPYNSIGPCQVGGTCLASVNVTASGNTTCSVATGDETLQGDTDGDFPILYKPSGTGVKSCVVLLDRKGAAPAATAHDYTWAARGYSLGSGVSPTMGGAWTQALTFAGNVSGSAPFARGTIGSVASDGNLDLVNSGTGYYFFVASCSGYITYTRGPGGVGFRQDDVTAELRVKVGGTKEVWGYGNYNVRGLDVYHTWHASGYVAISSTNPEITMDITGSSNLYPSAIEFTDWGVQIHKMG